MPKRACLRRGVLADGSFRERTPAKTPGRCERCAADDRVEAHHIIALVEGGSNDAATNGQALCFECHKANERGRSCRSRPE